MSCKDWQDVASHHSLAQWFWRRSGSCRTNDGWETVVGGTGQRGEDTALASQHTGGEDRGRRGETNGVFGAGSPERSRWAEARCCQASQRRRLRVAILRRKCERRRIRDRAWCPRLRTSLVRSFGGVPTTSDGAFYRPLNSFKRHQTRLRQSQQSMSRKKNRRKSSALVRFGHAVADLALVKDVGGFGCIVAQLAPELLDDAA